MRSGEFRSDIVPDTLGYVVLGTLTGAHAQAATHPELALTPLLQQAMDATLRSVLEVPRVPGVPEVPGVPKVLR